MANLNTNTDIVNAALFHANELIDGSSAYEAKALEYVNRAYLAIASGGTELDPGIDEVWWWLRSDTPNVINLEPVIETGTLLVTEGSTSITFSSAPTKSLARWFLRTVGTQDVFRIVSHTALSIAATLDGGYTGETNAAIAYTAFKLEYDLPENCMEVISPMRTYQQSMKEINGMELSALERDWPLSEIWQGVPEAYAMVSQRRLRFSHSGDTQGNLIRVDHDFLQLPTDLAKDTNEPLIPREFRRVLSDYACGFILLDKSDSKVQDVLAMAKAGLQGMAKENRTRKTQISNNFGAILPRQGQLRSRVYPLRTTGGRIIGW